MTRYIPRPTRIGNASFAERCRAARLATGLSQAELAGRLGVRSQSVSNWENERSVPWEPEATLKAIATCLKWTMQGIPVPRPPSPAPRRRVSDFI